MFESNDIAIMNLRVSNLEFFARQAYPKMEDLQTKSVYLALLKMNPTWAKNYLINIGKTDMLNQLEGQGVEFLTIESWALELQSYWISERDQEGKSDANIHRKCPEEI